MRSFNPRTPATRNSTYPDHTATGLTIPYSVKSGTHADNVTFQIEGTRQKARILLAANDEEQATLILQAEEIEALHARLGEVLKE